MESINDKYHLIFRKHIESCNVFQNNSCPVVVWYNSCIGDNLIEEHTSVFCPFFKAKVTFHCKLNGEWNGTENMFFDLCNGVDFLFRTEIEKFFGIFLYPLQLILLLTSIFKISIFDGIINDFNWRIIVWYLRSRTIKYGISWLMVIMNSNYLVSALCIPLTVIPVFSDFFCLACQMTLFFYVYIILHRFDVQIRTIKSAMFRVTVMTPILATTVCIVLDMNMDDHYNYFECESDIYGSRIVHGYITFHICVTIIVTFLWIGISKKIKRMLRENLAGLFRIEYDIIGARKEIAKREIFRVAYILKWLLGFCVFEMVLFNFSIYQVILQDLTKHNFLITASSVFMRSVAEMIVIIAIIWANKHFRKRQEAFQKWYIEISDEKNSVAEEEFFKFVLKETDRNGQASV